MQILFGTALLCYRVLIESVTTFSLGYVRKEVSNVTESYMVQSRQFFD